MWNFFYQMASPKMFCQRMQVLLPGLWKIAVALLSVGIVWGLFFAPADYQQKDAVRIMYIHVPAAFLSLSLYAGMGFLSLLFLVWRIKIAGVMISQVAKVGAYMAFVALSTGSIWGKPMWGAWWVWDARLTSELILFFLYLAVIVVSHAYGNQEQSDKMVAVLSLVGLVDLPIIHFSVYWWNTLHQGATLSLFAKPKIATSMLIPLLFTFFGLLFYCCWLLFFHVSNALLWRERRQHWVRVLVEKKGLL
jgi:heme exporter protein C